MRGAGEVTSCIQASENNCAAIPSNISGEIYINTGIGVLVNTIDDIEINYHNGRKARSSGGTQFVLWTVAESVKLANTTLVRPDTTQERRAHIIDQKIVYTADLNYSISVPFSHLNEKGLHAKLWKLDTAIEDVKKTMMASPFIVDIKLVMIIAIVVIIMFPVVLMLGKVIIKRTILSKKNHRNSEDSDQFRVPPRTVLN